MLRKRDGVQTGQQSSSPQKNSSYKFSQSTAKKRLIQICVSLCPITQPQGGKARHHKGNKGVSVKLPHCTSLTLTYLMENEMPLVHHSVKWWGYDYTNKDGLSERIL